MMLHVGLLVSVDRRTQTHFTVQEEEEEEEAPACSI